MKMEAQCYSIAAFQKYVRYLHPGCDALWQKTRDFPNIAKTEKAQTWYCNSPVGGNILKTKMAAISEKFGLSRRYTNHCVRSSAITCLNDADVEARHIATITKHKNLASIDRCVRDASEAQKRGFSKKLQQVPQATSSSTDDNRPSVCDVSREILILPSKPYTTYKLYLECLLDSNTTPYEYFQMFVLKTFYDDMAEKTNLYAAYDKVSQVLGTHGCCFHQAISLCELHVWHS